jgi:uncharacterized OB-fold protein
MNQLAETYDKGLRDGTLLLQYCDKCERTIMYPKHRCPHCFGTDLSWVRAEGAGTLYSFTVQRLGAPSAFVDQLPYALGVVRLAEGVQLLGRLLPDEDGEWTNYRCNVAVELCSPPSRTPVSGRPVAWFRATEPKSDG